jgi:N-acetylated-alpha-linked acidic dipeptidase
LWIAKSKFNGSISVMAKRPTLFRPAALIALLGIFCTGAPGYGDSDAIRGFFTEHVGSERAAEQKLLQIPDAANAEANLRQLTAEPHMAGTEASHRVAQWLLAQYQSYGFDAAIESYSVYLPSPKERELELVEPEKQTLATPEQPYEWDKDTYDARAVPAFNAYSASGEATAQVVYVNYGMVDDYRRLDDLGVRVDGKIVIARYGQGFRGIKAQLAEEHKAAALLIYSDPADDGFFAGDPYPRGPWRPASGIQRGSILYTSKYPGDPLTPGVAATADAKRLSPADAKSLPHIPVLPINARDAAVILSHMGGQNVPHGWQGTLPFTYHLGPGEAVVHLKLQMDYQQRNIYDVIARIHGEDDNSWVLFGNHHDAWVFGAVDPNSGTASMLEAARALGRLARDGWKPKRTIIFCEWDAEEFGLIGSTEWVEAHQAELQQKALTYVNTDVGVAGPEFGASAVPSLKEFVREVTQSVSDPGAGRSVFDVWKERLAKQAVNPTGVARSEPKATGDDPVPLGALGAGSDFCPFLDHAGIPAVDMGFGGPYGVYHSLYDDFYWMKHFGDPSFAYHAAMGRIIGTMALRLSNADVMPFDYSAYAREISGMVTELQKRATEVGTATAGNNAGKGAAPSVDMNPAVDAAAQLTASAQRAQQALNALGSAGMDAGQLAKVNHELAVIEQDFLAAQGLAGRPWYRHQIYAPGSYTGYESVVIPGVREPLDRKDYAGAQAAAAELAESLRRAATQLDAVVKLTSSSH